jgi:hypothetical protein
MLDPIKNLVYVNALIGYSASDLIITLQSGEGAKLPQPSTDGTFNLVWYNHSIYKNPADDPSVEIIRVTGRSGDVLTVSRAQESTVASNKNTSGANYRLILGLTKKMIDDIQAALNLKATMFPGMCAMCPIGANDISIDYTTRILTITPPLGYFRFYVDGSGVIEEFVKTGAVSFPAFTDTSGIWYFYFDNNGDPIATQTPWTSFDSVAPVYRILWNASLSGSAKAITENLETHENTIPGVDHNWKHNYGTVWSNGFVLANNALASGAPNVSGLNTVVGMTTGTNIDDNLQYTITNSTGGLKFQQDLGEITPANLTISNSAQFEIRYDASGLRYVLPATRFPFAWDTGTNRPQYITSAGVRTLVPAGDYFVYFAFSIQDPRNGKAVRLVSAPLNYGTLTLARAVTWTDIQGTYPTLSDKEVRPLYKMIFQYNGAYNVAVKYTALRETADIRVGQVTPTTAVGSTPASSVTETFYGNAQTAIDTLRTSKLDLVGGLLTGALNEAQGANIASATTTDIGAATGNFVDVTGTTTITALGTIQAGTRRIVRFTGDLILTHNATSLILPGNANITTVAGDIATFISLGAGNWVCANYNRGTGMASLTGAETLTNKTLTTPVLNGLPTGTGVSAASTASTLVARNSSKNIFGNNIVGDYTTTATAAGTTTLTVASTYQQYFTGTTTQIIVLPVVTTLTLGHSFQIVNNSTGIVTVRSSGANDILAIPAGSTAFVTCILVTGTTAASWSASYIPNTPSTGGGTSLWTAITGTRTANNTITVVGDQTAIFKKGMFIRWKESTVDRVGVISIDSTFSSVTTITFIGDTCASIDSNSFKYSSILGFEQFAKMFAYAGTIGSTGTAIANTITSMEPLRLLGADLWCDNAGTTNSTIVDININGTTAFTTKPSLATTVQSSPTPFTADTNKSLALGDDLTLDIDAIQTTPQQGVYVMVYLLPTRYLNLA